MSRKKVVPQESRPERFCRCCSEWTHPEGPSGPMPVRSLGAVPPGPRPPLPSPPQPPAPPPPSSILSPSPLPFPHALRAPLSPRRSRVSTCPAVPAPPILPTWVLLTGSKRDRPGALPCSPPSGTFLLSYPVLWFPVAMSKSREVAHTGPTPRSASGGTMRRALLHKERSQV